MCAHNLRKQFAPPGDFPLTCDVLGSDTPIPNEVITVGNHTLTVAVFAALYILCRFSLNSAFCLMDGSAMHYAERYNGSYAMCNFFCTLGTLIASYVAGALIIDPVDGVSELNDLLGHFRQQTL